MRGLFLMNKSKTHKLKPFIRDQLNRKLIQPVMPTSVNVAVPPEILQPDLFRNNLQSTDNGADLRAIWTNVPLKKSDLSTSNTVKGKIISDSNSQTININGKNFPFHPFGK